MRYLIFILLTSLSVISSAQQNVVSKEELLLQKELAFFQAINDSVKVNVLLEKVNIDDELGRPKDALNELQRIKSLRPTPDQLIMRIYKQMFNYFLANDFVSCSQFYMDSAELAVIHKEKEYLALKLYAYNETERWEECRSLLLQCGDSIFKTKVNLLPISYKKKSERQCALLSAFLPGLGQTKAGYPVKGLTSFMIHAGIGVFIVYNVMGGYYITPVVYGLFPVMKFYAGGKRQSRKLATTHNQRKSDELKQKYRELIFSISSL